MTLIVTGETVLIDETLSDYDALRVFFSVAEERGHAAPSVVVDERGVAITDPRYVDRMGTVHTKAGAWAFCRRPAAEALGLPAGTDWVRDHSMHLMFRQGSPFLAVPHLYHQMYVQPIGDPHPQPHYPLCEAGTVAWRHSGTYICVLEERLGRWPDATSMGKYLLWEYDPALGGRRLIVGFPADADLGFVELSYSPDDSWIHLCDGRSGRNLLVRVSDGAVIILPIWSTAVGWNPRASTSAMIAMIPERGTGLLSIYDYDLATNRTIKRSDMASPHGLPLTVRELSMSDDGRSALVTAPIATTGLEQRRRSGVHVATVIDIDDGAFEPVLPVAYQTGRAQRRHTSPRWCDDPLAMHSGPTTVADELLATATTSLIDPDSPAVNEDRLGRWLETAEGIEQAWRSGRMPAARFGDEFIQHLLNAYEIDECAADALFARLPPTSTAARHIRSSRQRGWRALGVYQEKAATTGSDDHRAAADPAPLPGPGLENVRPILVEMVAARTLADVQNAVARMLSWATPHGLAGDGVWRGLAELSATAMKRKDCLFALYCALVTICWNTEHMRRYPQLARLGLRNSPRSVELEILITGLDAVTRLDQDVLAGSAAGIDADDIRTTFQNRLSELSVANYLRTARTVPGPARTYTIIGPPDPMTRDTGVKERQLTRKRIFVSYVREDMDAVDQLVHALTESGFDVWMDRTHLLPGMRWQSEIKKAIRAGDYFIACFSPRYCNKLVSYMNEELIIAIEQLRLMPRNRRWFVPIMLETCEIPDLPIGPGETFSEFIQYADFSVNWDKAIRAVLDSLGPPTAT